ncbi:hypothetical protein [Planctomycetes bacterium K23_9]|uniref:Uncharacterized protein n=1 Tax=Stieleria marina TaxID=1930275 RepID=A0A517NT53_9BACT|nr:hypothetical protein K239x_22450 [Planctomycetes bacterium K23_9]
MEDSQQSTSAKKRPRFRFSLRTLLAILLIVALLFGAFQLGHDTGFEKGNRIGFAEGLNAKTYPVSYRASDLLIRVPADGTGATFAGFEKLLDEMMTTVQPSSWEGAGGPATCAPYPQNLSLVVSQTDRGHEEVAAFLEAKRRELAAGSPLPAP